MRFLLAINVKIAGRLRPAGSVVDLAELIPEDSALRERVAAQIVASRFGAAHAEKPAQPAAAPAIPPAHSPDPEPHLPATSKRAAKRAKG